MSGDENAGFTGKNFFLTLVIRSEVLRHRVEIKHFQNHPHVSVVVRIWKVK